MLPRTVIKWNYVFLYLCIVISFLIFIFFVVLSSNTCRDVLSFKLFSIVIETAPQWPGSRLVEPACVLEDNLMRVNCVTCYIQGWPQKCETSSRGICKALVVYKVPASEPKCPLTFAHKINIDGLVKLKWKTTSPGSPTFVLREKLT